MRLLSDTRTGSYLLWQYLRAHQRAAALIGLLDLLANFCSIYVSLLIAQTLAVQFGFQSVRSAQFGIPDGQPGFLLSVLGGVIFLKYVLDYLRFRNRGVLTEGFAEHLRQKAFEHLLASDLQRHEQSGSGRHVLRFSGDLSAVQRLLGRGVLQGAADLLLLLMGLCWIASLHVGLSVVVAIFLGVFAWVNRVVNRLLGRLERKRRSKKVKMIASLQTMLSHLSTIQAMNRQERVHRRFTKRNRQVFESGARYHRLSAFVSAMPLMVVQTLIVTLLWIGQYFQLSGAALFAIVLIMSSWRSALARVFQLGQIWEKGLLSLEKMALLLQRPVAMEGNEKLGTGADWLLEIEGMEYGGASPFFLRVHPGERHVIVGPNAAGKTTLVKLLAGLYRPSAGEIRWNGMPVEAFTLHSRRQKVAVVSDAFPLSGETLLDAISKGSGPKAQADARQLFEKWQAHLPALKGLDLAQSLNGNAIALSGGQSRILQCLRAVLADKPIWILDEPLAGLDDCSAIFLQNTMAQWPSDKAILVFTTQKNTQKEMGQVTFLNGADIVSNINH